jgi:hypothetical protein
LFWQMPVQQNLRPVESALLATYCRRCIGLDDTLDVMLIHLARKGAMRRFAHRRGGDDRHPVSGVPCRAAAEMRDLANQAALVPVDSFCELLEIGNDVVRADVDLAEYRGRVRGDERGAAEHRHADAALGLLLVIELIAQLRLSILRIGGGVRGADDAVFKCQMSQLKGLKKWVAGRHCVISLLEGKPLRAHICKTNVSWRFPEVQLDVNIFFRLKCLTLAMVHPCRRNVLERSRNEI